MKIATRSWLQVTALGLAFTLTACSGSDGDPEAEVVADAAQSNPAVILKTSAGNIEIELFPDEAPESVKNFLQYVDDGFYDGTIFHRVIPDFMVQGGGYDADRERQETRPPIKNEADNGLKNETGTVAMARTSIPDSATAQFFINVKDNAFLDFKAPTPQGYGYAVFGKIVSGMDVVVSIENAPTKDGGGAFRNLPEETVTIESASRK
jgi:cyclophilin family peptidyl-prolyl cis-trans isomerase